MPALYLAISILCLLLPLWGNAQLTQPPFTPAVERVSSATQRQGLADKSLVKGVEFRNIGPTVQSGRVVDLDVRGDDPSHFYVAYASGGLWKTENNGLTFEPLFDKEAVMTIGDIAVDWARNTIWVGTGEVNSSRSSYAGVGVYKSTDGGKSWQHLGLEESHHIGRIVLHPTNPNIAWVAVLGHLYSPNQERGVYMTTDGGQNWQRTLFVNDNAGAVDLVIDPRNADHLYAASWERTRRAWDFVESGKGSGIWKSTDGGKTWTSLTEGQNVFPTGEGAGRIGLDLASDGTLYAAIDNYNRRPKEKPEEDVLTANELRQMAPKDFLLIQDYLLKDYLSSNNFPEDYDVAKIKAMVEKEEILPISLAEYIEDANSLLFETPVVGLEVYRLPQGAKAWEKTHDGYLDDVYYSYGYYFGQIRVAPHDPKQLYVLGVPIIRSDDGGKSWRGINEDNVHADHHALWLNPRRPGHLVLGNDGGVNISYDGGKSYTLCNTPSVGQFYAVAVDMAKNYRVYGGLQDNGVWMGPHDYEASFDWYQRGQYPYQSIMGGDGMQVAVDPRDNETVYTGFQFGNYFRINTRSRDRKFITPKHKLGERPYRWNWQTPIHLSVHNPDILYMGSNFVHRSFNQGDKFEVISQDLTKGGRKGDVPFGTLTSLHESPLRFGLLYTGSDDGLVHVSRDGGYSWQNITAGLPEDMYVSRVQAGAFDEGTVYVSLNGYRWDNFAPLLYRSTDYGKTWEAIGQDLPLEPINVVKEDPAKANILYVGTDHGLYISFDKGKSFSHFNNNMPAVAVHDLVIHPREKELLIGTHGRSLYLASVKEVQQLDEQLMAKAVHLFPLDKQRYRSNWGGISWYSETSEPDIKLPVYAKSAGEATIKVQAKDGPVVATLKEPLQAGLNYVELDGNIDKKMLDEYQKWLNKKVKAGDKPIRLKPADNDQIYLQAGTYLVTVEKGGASSQQELIIE